MIQLLNFDEVREFPEVETKMFMIPDINLAQVANIEHYIRLLGLQDYVELHRDAITQSLTIKYNIRECADAVNPILWTDLGASNKIIRNNFNI